MSKLDNVLIRQESPQGRIIEYTPRKFDLGVPTSALNFQELRKRSKNDFKMAETIRLQTGLDKIDEEDLSVTVERKTLEKLQEIQEGAYKEAYKLGLEEGRKEAFQSASKEIDHHLGQLAELINSIENLKSELQKQNEGHLVKLVLHMAQRLADHEVTVNNECVVEIMRRAVQDAQLDENIVVQVAPEQFDFLEALKLETAREYEFLKKIKIAPVPGLRPGGCVIETNYGMIDARFDERVGKLWETMSENLYRIKEKIGAA